MRKLLKSKKSGIPAINEVVLIVLSALPPPVKLLLFLLLITTIATIVMPAMLNLFGYECIQIGNDINLYQVPMDNLLEKSLQDVKQGLRGIVGFEDYELPPDAFPGGDKRFLRIPPDCFIEANINGTTHTGYSSACVNCTKSGTFRYWNSICLDDGYYDPNIITKYWIGTANYCFQCAPPNPYYYNHSYCHNTDQCFFRIEDDSLLSDVTDDFGEIMLLNRIISIGGVKRTQNSDDIINIQCTDHQNPQLFFFSIELFDRTTWILLIVGYFLITLAYMYYSHTLH